MNFSFHQYCSFLIRVRSCIAIFLLLLTGLQNVYANKDQSTLSCTDHLKASKELLENNPDSAKFHASMAVELIQQLKSAEEQARALINLGDVCIATGEMPEALEAFQKAQTIVENAIENGENSQEIILAQTDLQLKIGVLHFYLKNFEKSLQYYDTGIKILESNYENLDQKELSMRKVRIYNNIAGVYIQQSLFSSALPYFQQAAEINVSLNDQRNESSLNNNIGICHMETGKYDLANHYFLKALTTRQTAGDKRGQAQVLNNLGKNQINFGNFESARDYFLQALSLAKEIGSRESMVISLESLSSVYDTLGDYRSSLRMFKEFKSLNDSLYSAENQITIARIEDSFRREKEKKIVELESKKREAENDRRKIWNIALAGSLFFLALTAFLLFKVMRAKVRNGILEQEKLKLEREKLEAQQKTLQENLDFKDRELTANALFLLKKNELIAHIAERLLKAKTTFKQENQQIIQEIVRDLQASQDDHNWQEFEAHFTRVHSGFYQTLQEKFPSLTPNERKLCAFLRLNMSTKDISAITQQSVNSITVARSRLRKKLQIEGEDVQLINFLMSIGG